MSLRMGLRPLAVCSALFAFSQIAPAQVKVAVVDLRRAVFESAEIKKADAEMPVKFKTRQDAVDKLQKEIAAISQQLQSSNGKLSPAVESDLNLQGQKKQRDLQRLSEDLQADAQAYRDDILEKSSKKMADVVKKLSEEKGYDVVINSSTALYWKPAMEITNEVIVAYDKAYPAK
jgi:outer membrane protein